VLLKKVDVNGGRHGCLGKLLGVMIRAELERGLLIERGLEEDFRLGSGKAVWGMRKISCSRLIEA
jgi:hypothetical protein